MLTVTDKRTPVPVSGNPTQVASYEADVISAADYSPFGITLPGRVYNHHWNKYRYGFNGKEVNKEVYGPYNELDYGFRIYDPRLGRFLSVDPLTSSYPYYTPYQFSGNNPIRFVDLDGKEQANPNAGTLSDAPVLDPKYKNVNINRTEIKADDVGSKFGIGLARTGVYTVAAITQMFGAAHYGSKVPKENFAKQFPLIPNDNIAKDLILPIFTTPAALMMELKKDPTNAELWGEASGIFLLAKGGKFAGTFKSEAFGLKVDLMGGERSRYVNGYINYDMKAVAGIADAVENFKGHFGKNTVGEIVVNNPQASFLGHVSESLRSDGTITVRGQMNNPYFSDIWNGTAKGLEGYDVIPGSKKTGLSTKGYNRTDGSPLRGPENSLNEIILIKKK